MQDAGRPSPEAADVLQYLVEIILGRVAVIFALVDEVLPVHQIQQPLSGNIEYCGCERCVNDASQLSRHLAIVLTGREPIYNLSVREVVAMGRMPYTGFFGLNSERDRINQWEYAMEQAKTEGKAEEKSLIAKNCKNSGIPYETIAKCTGLTIEEIEHS